MSHWTTRERSRRWSWGVAVLLMTLAGCSFTTIAYRYADRIIIWKIDHYFDLSSDQRHDLTQRLTPLLARHRHEALPEYETFLQEIGQRVERGLTSPDIDWIYATYDRLRTDLLERVVDDSGIFLASVNARQVRTFESALQKDNLKIMRLVQTPAPERLDKRAESILDWLVDWLGPLDKEQRAQIHEWSLALPDVQPIWVAYQQQRQQELLTLIQQAQPPERIARELRTMLVHYDLTAPVSYKDAVSQMRRAAKTMALAIDHSVTPEQRRHAVAKLQRLIEQVHELQAG